VRVVAHRIASGRHRQPGGAAVDERQTDRPRRVGVTTDGMGDVGRRGYGVLGDGGTDTTPTVLPTRATVDGRTFQLLRAHSIWTELGRAWKYQLFVYGRCASDDVYTPASGDSPSPTGDIPDKYGGVVVGVHPTNIPDVGTTGVDAGHRC